jgi:histidine triad (HIT) family protein
MDCIFCKIVAGVIPSYKIYEDDKVLAFLDINPVASGHTLLIPKKHFPTMADTPDELISYLYVRAKELMKKIKKAMNADYVVISVVGVDVPHFHIHLIPRNFNDGLAGFWPTKKYKEGEAENIAKQLTVDN